LDFQKNEILGVKLDELMRHRGEKGTMYTGNAPLWGWMESFVCVCVWGGEGEGQKHGCVVADITCLFYLKRLGHVTFTCRRHRYGEQLRVKRLAQGHIDSGGD